MSDIATWEAQARQDTVDCVIEVEGIEDWMSLLKSDVELHDRWAEEAGGTIVSEHQYLLTEARLNNVSAERTILSYLIDMGFILKELQVQFHKDRSDWGVCNWIADDPSYSTPSESTKAMLVNPSPYVVSLFSALWDTEYAGRQEFGLPSTQMAAAQMTGQRVRFLLHKTFVYRYAKLAPPSN